MVNPDNPNPELLLWAYARGIFPMADSRTRRIGWYSPDPRGILPLDDLHVSKSLARVVRAGRFEIRTDTAFERVMRECSSPSPGRGDTWIDERLIRAYGELHERGHAHSVEAWRGEDLVGGLYGVHLRAAFFGESMFSRPEIGGTDSSKVCLVHLVSVLNDRHFRLLDTQFLTPHLARVGCIEISRERYLRRLESALSAEAGWPRAGVLPERSQK